MLYYEQEIGELYNINSGLNLRSVSNEHTQNHSFKIFKFWAQRSVFDMRMQEREGDKTTEKKCIESKYAVLNLSFVQNIGLQY